MFFKLDLDEQHYLTLFEAQSPMIKRDSIKDDNGKYIDFFYTAIGRNMIPLGAVTATDVENTVPYMQAHPDEDVEFVHVGSRDGCFDGDEVLFAILSDDEVQNMIDMLQQALEDVRHPGKRLRKDIDEVAVGVVVPTEEGGLEIKKIEEE